MVNKRRRQNSSSGADEFNWRRFQVNTAALAVESARTLRVHTAALAIFALCETSGNIASAMSAKLQVLRDKKAAGQKPAFAAELFAELVSVLLTVKTAASTDLDVIRRHSTAISSIKVLATYVVEVTIWVTHEPLQTAIQLILKPALAELGGAVSRILEAAGAIVKFESAPPRPLERNVAADVRHARSLI